YSATNRRRPAGPLAERCISSRPASRRSVAASVTGHSDNTSRHGNATAHHAKDDDPRREHGQNAGRACAPGRAGPWAPTKKTPRSVGTRSFFLDGVSDGT